MQLRLVIAKFLYSALIDDALHRTAFTLTQVFICSENVTGPEIIIGTDLRPDD